MIKPHCFQKEWIDSFRQQADYRKINPPLMEKMIHALSLLQYLQTQGLSFIFKGGTSLLLLLDNANRFSVDIDIITEETQDQIEAVLNEIIEVSHFKNWSLDARRSYKPGVPKAHYELEYDSQLNKNSNYILLDILFDKPYYPTVVPLPIISKWIETETIIHTTVPTVEAITGDKLTAFAPTTTGILYGKGKEQEIVKQLFDLGTLFDQVESIEEIAKSFAAFAAQEIGYRQLSIGPEDILADTLNACTIISLREKNRSDQDKLHFAEMQKGIKDFSHFLISGHFIIEHAIVAAAKTAYLCAKLIKKDFSPLLRYNNEDISNLFIKNPEWNALNKIKNYPDKSSFYFWYQALTVLEVLN